MKTLGGAVQLSLALSQKAKQCLGMRHGMKQPVLVAMTAGLTLRAPQPLEVRGIFDHLAFVPAAHVLGDQLFTIEDAQSTDLRCDQQRAIHAIVWDRVAIAVERHVGSATHGRLDPLMTGKGLRRHGQQMRSLFEEGLIDRSPPVLWPGSLGGTALTPVIGIPVESFETPALAQRNEGGPQVANRALDPTFLIAASWRHGARIEAIVISQLEETRVVTDRVPLALEHDAAQVVVEHRPGNTAKPGEGLDMRGEEAGQPRVVEEAKEESARVAQHHDEGVEDDARHRRPCACRSEPSPPEPAHRATCAAQRRLRAPPRGLSPSSAMRWRKWSSPPG